MSRIKTAALTGVLYYLYEEQQDLTAVDPNSSSAGIPAWAFAGRTISALQRRVLQGRKFPSAPVRLQLEENPGVGGALLTRAGKAAELSRWSLGRTAGRRKIQGDCRKARS